jgi:hypothetical protein
VETTGKYYTTRDITTYDGARFTHDSYSYGHMHSCRLLMLEWAVTGEDTQVGSESGISKC